LVTSAGIAQPSRQRSQEFGSDITDVTDADFAEVVEVNLHGTSYVIRAAVPLLRRNEAPGAAIVTMSSVGVIALLH
jgi:NAD(P)-dependent dehydrogenase (short-subunit alcohol dehydrogenase family)